MKNTKLLLTIILTFTVLVIFFPTNMSYAICDCCSGGHDCGPPAPPDEGGGIPDSTFIQIEQNQQYNLNSIDDKNSDLANLQNSKVENYNGEPKSLVSKIFDGVKKIIDAIISIF